MVAIPPRHSPTVAAIWQAYEAAQEDGYRPHLGASLIGNPCSRALWYSFRWATQRRHSGQLLRLFASGHLEEARLVRDLRAAGIEVHVVDETTGQQFSCRDDTGHFGGSADGVALGILEAPKTWHLLEFKTHNERSFQKLLKEGVASKPLHVAQMKVYMHLMGLERAFYLARNKNNDGLYSERLHADPEHAIRLIAKARRIIESPVPLERISDDPTWFECRFCDHHAVCHGDAVPEAHCRSCLHTTPRDGGVWHCALDKPQELADQKAGCPEHLYIPQLIPGEQIDAGDRWVSYRMKDGTIWRDGVQE